jgi:hypothetical protein
MGLTFGLNSIDSQKSAVVTTAMINKYCEARLAMNARSANNSFLPIDLVNRVLYLREKANNQFKTTLDAASGFF